MEILCFFAGIAFVYTKSVYPFLLLIISLYFKPNWTLILWFGAALIWGMAHQYWVDAEGMPAERVLAKAELDGVIVSIPASSLEKTQFQFQAHRLNGKPVQAKIILACYRRCPQFKAGEVWRFQAKLKRPQNLGNPGSYDYVSSLKARHIDWAGYIKGDYVRLSEATTTIPDILVWRERLAETLEKSEPDNSVLGILQALTLNVTTHISKDQWELFRRTGTTHLMVISGSHIGLIAGFCYWLMKVLWLRLGRLSLYFPAIKMAALVGVLAALFYALLAGFEPPSQRSVFACFFLLAGNFLNRRFTVWQAWRYGLLLVLIYEPHAVLLPGFYLSFIAVAILFLINKRIVGSKIKKTISIQLACLFGLMPLTLYWFSYGAVNGLIANLLAIPLVGFVIVPFALIHLLLLQAFDLEILDVPIRLAINWLLQYLHWVDSFAVMNLNFSYPSLLIPLALMLAMALLLFLPIKAILPAVGTLILAAIFPAYQRVAPGEARVDVLDVGQGLAVVVHTAKHVLVYDTGMKFYQGGDMGKLAMIPYLNHLGIHKLDKIIISHPDLDHRGGLPSLEEFYPNTELIVDKVAFYKRGQSCHQYPPWVWDEVSFQFMPISQKFRDKNNSSCVLKIETKQGRVLLTGDIEKKGEEFLVKNYGEQLRAEILLIPHHGSKTSSSFPFLREIAPNYAVISSGFDNRYHFPHRQTIEMLAMQKITSYNTADCGMVRIDLTKGTRLDKPLCYNSSRHPTA